MRKIVLDTNAYSRLMEGDKQVLETLNEAGKIYLPVFVVAELLLGFKKGNRETRNRDILKKFESKDAVDRYFPTNETIEIFTDLFLILKKEGRPIPVHDLWIAAIAIETGSVIVTYDKHFLHITKARIWNELH